MEMTNLKRAALDYSPAHLLNELRRKLGIDSDAELARRIGVAKCVLSKVRAGLAPLSSGLILRIHELSGWTIAEIGHIVGDRRARVRMRTTRRVRMRTTRSVQGQYRREP